jgi:hypothetical protein
MELILKIASKIVLRFFFKDKKAALIVQFGIFVSTVEMNWISSRNKEGKCSKNSISSQLSKSTWLIVLLYILHAIFHLKHKQKQEK